MAAVLENRASPRPNAASALSLTAVASDVSETETERADGCWRAALHQTRQNFGPDARVDELQQRTSLVPDAEIVPTLQALARDELRSDFGLRLFERWAEREPRLAALWAVQHEDKIARDRMLQTAVVGWAEQDFAGALAWLDAMAENNSKNLVRSLVGEKAVEAQPLVALRLALELEASEDAAARSPSLLKSAMAAWARADRAAALAWVQRQPQDDLRDRLIVTLTAAWARSDGLAALEFALAWLPAGAAQTQAVGAIVQRAPEAASGWIGKLSDETLRNSALPAFVSLWAARDATAAGAWLEALPPGAERDAGAAAYIRLLAARMPETAVAWVLRISDPELRERCLEDLRTL